MLWQIEDSNTYLLGSVHLTNQAQLSLPGAAGRIFEQADRVIFEADPTLAVDASVFVLPSDCRLDKVIDADLFRQVHAHWSRFGLPAANLSVLRPVMVATTLQFSEASRHGYLTEFGVDHVLRARAEQGKKRIEYLEDLNDQLRMLMNTPLPEQASILEHIATKSDVGLSEVEAMAAAWRNGDVGYFENLLEDRTKCWPQSIDALLTKRNENWVPHIADVARTSTSNLIVVGALHLVGPTGLPVLLQRHGLRLTPR